jgi:hypothetical protein
MNKSEEILAFSIGEMRIHARHDDKPVTREVWAALVAEVKSECAGKNAVLSQFEFKCFSHFSLSSCTMSV